MDHHSPRASLDSLQHTFSHLLNSGVPLSKIRDSALSSHFLPGSSSKSTLIPGRSIAWKLFLGPHEPLDSEIKPTYLLESLRTSRKQYADLLLEKMRAPDGSFEENFTLPGPDSTPRREASDSTNLERNNPLSLHVGNPWVEWFASVELRKTIHQDVERTFPDIDFFRSAEVQNQLTTILFIYSVMNPSVGYRQGMHEVLAPLLYAVDYDSIADDEANTLPNNVMALGIICGRSWVAADAWALFDSVMKSLSRWYEWRESRSVPEEPSGPLSTHVQINVVNGQMEPRPYVAPIVQACNRIQSNLLRSTDPTLWKHMQATGIEPQIYGIRWLRMLFTREFSMADAMKLWDGLFACDPSFELTPWICVAMLIRIRNDLLPADYTGQLTVLLRYPTPPEAPVHLDSVHHASLLLRQALALQLAPTPEAGASLMIENLSLLGIPMDVPEPPPPPPSRRRQDPGSARPRLASPLHPSHPDSRPPGQQPQMGYPEMIARGLLERGESFGVGKTLLHAVSEIRRNIPDLAATLVRPATSAETSFPLIDERPPEERPPWEPRTRLEMEREISDLRRRNQQFGKSLAWIVDALLQDEEQATHREKVKERKQQALESLSYIRDTITGDVLLDQEALHLPSSAALTHSPPVNSPPSSATLQPTTPVPATVVDTRRKTLQPTLEQTRSHQRQTSVPSSFTENTPSPARLAPWAYTRSSFSGDGSSSLPATTLPRPPPPTSTGLRKEVRTPTSATFHPVPHSGKTHTSNVPTPLQDPLGALK